MTLPQRRRVLAAGSGALRNRSRISSPGVVSRSRWIEAMSSIVGRVQSRQASPDAPSPMRRHGVGAEIVVAFLDDAIVRGDDRALRRIDQRGHPAPIDDAVPFVFPRPAGNRQPAIAARTPRNLAAHAIADLTGRRPRRRDCGRSAPIRASLHRASRRFRPASWEAACRRTGRSPRTASSAAQGQSPCADRRRSRARAASRSPR